MPMIINYRKRKLKSQTWEGVESQGLSQNQQNKELVLINVM